MNIISLIRLILKNGVLVLSIPFALILIVFLLTMNLPKSFTSQTSIYTGIGTGYSLGSVQDAGFDFLKTNASFDNLINIINSRTTQEEVGLRLLAQHLSIGNEPQNYILPEHLKEIQKNIFDSIKIISSGNQDNVFAQLKQIYESNDHNFIYKLLNGNHPYYSANAISSAHVKRISNSDLIELNYECNDPGVCQNTLIFLNQVFMKNYRNIKKGETNNVVEYFENQLKEVKVKLNDAEENLLNFNKDNRIINYYEQTKHISETKEDIDIAYEQELMKSAAAKASIYKIEDQLNRRNKTLLKSSGLNDLREELSKITTQIAIFEVQDNKTVETQNELARLYDQSSAIKNELSQVIREIGLIENTTAGLTQQDLMTKWLDQIILYEESSARISIFLNKINDLKRIYAEYAPLGATMMRIERQISVTEREYLAILKGLNDSKIMQRNIEMSTNLDIIDKPNFPVQPKPSNRMLLVIAAGFVGFVLTVFSLIVTEYFDTSIKSHKHLSKLTNLPFAGSFPNLNAFSKNLDRDYIIKRSSDEIANQIRQKAYGFEPEAKYKPFITVVFSTMDGDGKTSISHRLYNIFQKNGYNVAYFNYKINGQLGPNDKNCGCHYYDFEDLFTNDFKIEPFFENLLESDFKKMDFIFLEIPPILKYTTPVRMMRNVHFALMVARSNRPWIEAETHVLNSFKKSVVEMTETEVLANGVSPEVLESILGELPKQRSVFRIFVKKLIKFQFSSKTHL